MKGITVRQFGGPEVCEFVTDLPIPEPNDDQIQIKVSAAGVNPIDTYIRSGSFGAGKRMPYTPGLDASGVITKLGKNVKNFKVGDRVFTCSSDTGSYAEYTLSMPLYTFKLPDNLSFEEGSAIGVPYFTAYRALFFKGHCRPGQSVLIHGASGSVGLAAVQLAKVTGLRTIGTAGSEAGMELVKSQGADFVFNHKEPDYMAKIRKQIPEGVDMVIEMLASVNLNSDMQILRAKHGRIVVVGSRGSTTEINSTLFMAKELVITGVTLYSTDPNEFILMNSHVSELLRRNIIKPVISTTYPLQEASAAHSDIMNNSGATGRLTLLID